MLLCVNVMMEGSIPTSDSDLLSYTEYEVYVGYSARNEIMTIILLIKLLFKMY